jgi:RNA 2',3'-cyclic 3'-phosphodiesterase
VARPGAPRPGEEPLATPAPARLFVGTWPPPDVVAALSSLDRPGLDGVRWTTPDQWHVTVAFLGDVALSVVDEVGAALVSASARTAGAPEAHLGPATRRVGRAVLCVPVDGLDELAARIRRALSALLPDAHLDEPFHGHLTLARGRGGRPLPATLAGVPVDVRWRVRELALVHSTLAPSGARYMRLVTATVPS